MLKKETVENFIKRVASDTPAPGGGSAAALAGALGTALFLMAVKITLAKINKGPERNRLFKAAKQLDALTKSLMLLIDKDAEAYNKAAKAFRLPKNTAKETKGRQKKIRESLRAATEAPFKTAILSLKTWEIIKKVKRLVSKNLFSDVETAGFLIGAALGGAIANVKINLAGIKDKKFQRKIAKFLRPIESKTKAIWRRTC